jgi:hypothetical protein
MTYKELEKLTSDILTDARWRLGNEFWQECRINLMDTKKIIKALGQEERRSDEQ